MATAEKGSLLKSVKLKIKEEEKTSNSQIKYNITEKNKKKKIENHQNFPRKIKIYKMKNLI